MNTKDGPKVTEAELTVLRELWRRGDSTIRELTDSLYPDGGTSAYATVQKLLDRLAAKGCVSRRAEGRANVFSAKVGRSDLIGHRLQDIADTFFGGALSPLLTHLVTSSKLSGEDVSSLRQLVDDLDADANEGDGR